MKTKMTKNQVLGRIGAGVMATATLFTPLACKEYIDRWHDGEEIPVPEYHYIGKIRAFGEVITIKGYKDMDEDKFSAAVEMMSEVFSTIEKNFASNPTVFGKFKTMAGRSDFAIVIEPGDDAPAVSGIDDERIMTIGVDYFIEKDNDEIRPDILTLVAVEDAFAAAKSNNNVFLANNMKKLNRQVIANNNYRVKTMVARARA